jgi:signal transduction histidine kinase
LLASYLVLALVVLVALEVPLGVVGTRRERDGVRANAERDATVLAALSYLAVDPDHDRPHGADSDHQREVTDLNDLTRRYVTGSRVEVLVVDANRNVIAYQSHNGETRPDTRQDLSPLLGQALEGNAAVAAGTTEGEATEVAAQPITNPGGQVVGAVQVTVSAQAAQHRALELVWALIGFAALVLAVAAAVGVLMARSVARPLASLETAVRSLESGDLDVRARPGGPKEIRTVAVAFNSMADRLRELINSQRNFLADASHQLRSPLTALRLRLEAINPDDREGTRRHLAGAVGEVERLSRLTEGLLALMRVEGRRPSRKQVAVGDIVRERAAIWEAFADEREVHLRVDLPAEPLLALDVEGHLEQALDNLLANALQVAPAGSEISLAAQSTVDGDRSLVEVTVTDEGPGMTPEERASAFERFWQHHDNRTGRTGLGLTISRQLSRASGGDLLLDDAPGGGLRATVQLEAASA